jgi:hypothetical protein
MTSLTVKEAVQRAKAFVEDVLEGEGPTNIGLEEVEYSPETGTWKVTIGFSRPWNSTRGALATITGEQMSKRAYRIVAINDNSGEPVSMTKRELLEADG